ncbi:MAG: hypothetical protein ABW352_10975 [Polyangiales bacterium]
MSRLVILLTVLLASSVRAQDLPRVSPDFHADAEVDPAAYILRGYSVHFGLGYRMLRLDVGAFGIELPEFLHGNQGFDASSHGFGLKLQYFPFADQRGFFVGVDSVIGTLTVEREHTDLARSERQRSLGAHLGYRFTLPQRFYITLWGGLGYEFRARDIRLGDRVYDASPLAPFAAVHLGYRFL